MPHFSETSKARLASCHPDLQALFNEVIKHFDCKITCGHRGHKDQAQAFYERKSKVLWPLSKHNKTPSLAVDVAPWPIDWDDLKRFYLLAGYVIATADQMGLTVRWGGDWDGDKMLDDQTFNDLPHWELREPKPHKATQAWWGDTCVDDQIAQDNRFDWTEVTSKDIAATGDFAEYILKQHGLDCKITPKLQDSREL